MSLSYYGSDGSPLTGRVPVQTFVHGDGDREAALNEAEGLVQVFAHEVRLSQAAQHRKDAPLSDGGEVHMFYSHGTMVVDVYTVPKKVGGEPFYGGILVKLNVVADEPQFRLDCMKDAPPADTMTAAERLFRHDLKGVISHAKFSGASDKKPGRPAVPGTEDSDAAEWLILQIAKDIPLDNEPFKNEAIKIYRIANPKFGAVVEYGGAAQWPAETSAVENLYLMSAEPAYDSLGHTALVNFFMCGQRLEDIPPLGAAGAFTTYLYPDNLNLTISLYTVGFQPDSFETAFAAGGIVIVALIDKLYALNTAEKNGDAPATWKLLHTAAPVASPALYANFFGSAFTETADESGRLTITCAGSNAHGPCSGYTVTITPDPAGGLPVIAGEITLRERPDRAGTAATVTAQKDMSKTHAGYATYTLAEGGYVNYYFPSGDEHSYYQADFIPGLPYRLFDPYLGGELPRNDPTQSTYRASWVSNFTRTFEDSSLNYINHWYRSFSLTTLNNYAIWAEFFDDTSSSVQRDWTFPTVPPSETNAADKRRRIAGPMYRTRWRSIEFVAVGSPTTPYSTTEDLVFEQPGAWHWGAMSVDYKILNPDGSARFDWGNIAAKFPTTHPELFDSLTQTYTAQSGVKRTEPFDGGETGNTTSRVYFDGYPPLVEGGSQTWALAPGEPFDYGKILVSGGGGGYPRAREYPSWSYSLTYDPTAPTKTVTPAVIAGIFPASLYGLSLDLRAWLIGEGNYSVENRAGFPLMDVVGVTYRDSLADPTSKLGGVWNGGDGYPEAWMAIDPVDDRYIRDPRTGGFVAQMYWCADNPENPASWALLNDVNGLGVKWLPRTRPVSCEIIVGNDVSTVPLKALLNEWMELGETVGSFGSLPLVYDLVFIDDRGAQQVMLI